MKDSLRDLLASPRHAQIVETALLEAEILGTLDEIACEGVAAYIERHQAKKVEAVLEARSEVSR